MTVCNLSIEMGARGGMIAPDQNIWFLEREGYTLRETNGRKQWTIVENHKGG
jgi:homoaconitase/3-isopropylmalate dehydratase large subunit